MLVISRKVGESLIISDNIKITIVSVGPDKITVGINAPKEIKVVREELVETIEANIASNEKVEQTEYKDIAILLKNKKIINNGNK
jgi:carbon storage regulator